MVDITSYELKNDKEFAAKIRSAADKVGDLRFAMGEIARDWFKSNKTIFTLKSSGLYPALSPAYARTKERVAGSSLPILVVAKKGGGESGTLRDSVTKMNDTNAIVVVGKDSVILGTKVDHGIFHQSDQPRTLMPLRKFLFIGPEAPSNAPSRITGRLQRFVQIIDNDVESKLDTI